MKWCSTKPVSDTHAIKFHTSYPVSSVGFVILKSAFGCQTTSRHQIKCLTLARQQPVASRHPSFLARLTTPAPAPMCIDVYCVLYAICVSQGNRFHRRSSDLRASDKIGPRPVSAMSRLSCPDIVFRLPPEQPEVRGNFPIYIYIC